MRRNLMLRAGGAVWCVAVAVASLHGQQLQTAAHVLDIKGEWRLDGSAGPLTAGQGLAAGAKITAGSNRPGDAITIVRDEDLSRQRVACDGSATNPCRNPIIVQGAPLAAAANRSEWNSMVQAALAVLLDRPPAIESHYALTLTRGKETVQESEAVVALDPAQGVVLPPPPLDFPAGHYTVSFTRAGEKSTATGQTAEQTAVLTSEGVWMPLALQAPGVYDVSIVNGDRDQVADVMLLVTPAAQVQAKREALDAMKSRTATWTGPNARADEHLFLRGFLLSESQP